RISGRGAADRSDRSAGSGAVGRRGHHRRHHTVDRGDRSGADLVARVDLVDQYPVAARGRRPRSPWGPGGFVSEPVNFPSRIDADPESVERGLVTLVLTLVELLRQLMERQALHRMDAGDLSDEQIERLGTTLMLLEQRMAELRDHFGLTPEDLNIDLGPLGTLL